MPSLEEDISDDDSSVFGGSPIQGPEHNDTNLDPDISEEPGHLTRTQKNHPVDLVIGDISSPIITRKMCKSAGLRSYNQECKHAFYLKMSLSRFMKH